MFITMSLNSLPIPWPKAPLLWLLSCNSALVMHCKYKCLCTISFAYVCTVKNRKYVEMLISCLWIWKRKRYKVNVTLYMFRDIILEITRSITGYFYGAKLEDQLCAAKGLLEILNYHSKHLWKFKLDKNYLFFFLCTSYDVSCPRSQWFMLFLESKQKERKLSHAVNEIRSILFSIKTKPNA